MTASVIDGSDDVSSGIWPRSASLLKYACNAYHALKVAFANEVGSLAKALGADGREVMRLVCCDTKLNVSPAYLRPGFAFGGSCLPKDVRALTRYAEREAIRLPLLSAVLPSNHEHLQRAIRLIEGFGCRRLGLVGLSFKAGTDDLRESPFVALAETLIGRGYDLRIFDPVINVSRLCGRNRAYMDEHLPHLASLLVDSPRELYEHASLLLIATDVADDLDLAVDFEGIILDLRRALVANDPASAPDEIAAAEGAGST
jgi:GDP-mannose 6-dehydrogenase